MLNAARYRVGGAEELNAANAVLQNPDVSAVTLVDVVIFRQSLLLSGGAEPTSQQVEVLLNLEGSAEQPLFFVGCGASDGHVMCAEMRDLLREVQA